MQEPLTRLKIQKAHKVAERNLSTARSKNMVNVQGPVELLKYFITPEDTTAPQTGVAGPGIVGTMKVFFHICVAMGLTVAISVLN